MKCPFRTAFSVDMFSELQLQFQHQAIIPNLCKQQNQNNSIRWLFSPQEREYSAIYRKGMLWMVYLEKVKEISGEYYSNLLTTQELKTHENRPGLQNNAPAHNSNVDWKIERFTL